MELTGGVGDDGVLVLGRVEEAVAAHHLRPGGQAQAVQPPPLCPPCRVLQHTTHTHSLKPCPINP